MFFPYVVPGKETKDQRNNRDQMIKGSKELKPKQAQRMYVGIGSPHEKSEFPERRCNCWWILDISPRRRERGTSITQVGSAYLLYVLHINATGTYDITACGLDPHSRPTCLAVGPEQTDQTCGGENIRSGGNGTRSEPFISASLPTSLGFPGN